MRFYFSASISVVTGLAALMALPAAAQSYPTKPIRILIAQAPGSATDNISRVLTGKLAGQMGQQFIIEARPGAGGAVAGRRLHAVHGQQFHARFQPGGL